MIYDEDKKGPYVCGRVRKYYYDPDKLGSRVSAKVKAARDAGEVFNPSSAARKVRK